MNMNTSHQLDLKPIDTENPREIRNLLDSLQRGDGDHH